MSHKPKPHPQGWFQRRVGKLIVRDGKADIFNTIEIKSDMHARALYVSQYDNKSIYTDHGNS